MSSRSIAENNLDTCIAMQTPEGIEYDLYPAGIPVRICAWGIDYLIINILFFVLLLVFNIFHILGLWFFFLINFALNWFYYFIFEMIWNGQSPGKRIMGIRVVGSDGSPVSAGSSFLRNLLRFADGFFYLYLIAFLCMSFSPGFRRIGDWAGDTLVIYGSRSRLPKRLTASTMNVSTIPWLRDIPQQTPWRKLSYEEKQGLLMFARRFPVLGKARADEIARPWVASLKPYDISSSEYLLGIAHSISGSLGTSGSLPINEYQRSI